MQSVKLKSDCYGRLDTIQVRYFVIIWIKYTPERTNNMNNVYESPLSSRYASKEMLYTFSSDMKSSPWRRLWL